MLLAVLLLATVISSRFTQHSFDDITEESMINPLHEEIKMTTRELTLNLSGISFPQPIIQGDNLNLSGLSIQKRGACAKGYLLNTQTDKCQLADLLLMQNFDAPNFIQGNLSLDQLKNKQEQFMKSNPKFIPIRCEGQKPFLSRKGCTSCLEPYPQFNLELLKCVKCPRGSAYNPSVRNCQMGISYVSNLQNKNYLSLPGKTLSQYRQEYDKLRQQNPSVEICPDDKPFSVGGECVSCPLENPLFFLPARTCTKCKQGTKFNPESNSCLAPVFEKRIIQSTKRLTQRWTLEKGVGNILGWQRSNMKDLARTNTDQLDSQEQLAY